MSNGGACKTAGEVLPVSALETDTGRCGSVLLSLFGNP